MAADTVETFITAVQTILDRNYGASVNRGLQAQSAAFQDDTPSVTWRYDDGRIAPPQKTGSVAGAYYTDVQVIIATCWGADRGDARTLMHNLFRACREAADGPSVNPGRYKWLTEDTDQDKKGAMLDVWIELHLPVLSEPTAYPTPTFQVTSQRQFTAIQDPATGHTTLA